MTVDTFQLGQHGVEIVDLLRRMAMHGKELFRSNRIFKGLCLAAPGFLAFWWLFGGSSTSGSAPAPPPIIVGPSGPSGAAPYQFSTPQQSPDPGSVQRQQLFYGIYDSLRNEPRAGLKCERLATAVEALTGLDRTQPLPQAVAAIGDADSCRAAIALSNSRFTALTQAAAAFQADEAPATTTVLSRTGQSMTKFDRSREVADQNQGLFDLAQSATSMLQDSDARLKAFSDASPGASSSATLAAQMQLAEAAQSLINYDRLRLSATQLTTYKTAVDLAEQFAESDHRIGKAIHQIDGAAQDITHAGRAALVDAVGALTLLDLQRVTDAQKDRLDNAKAAIRDTALALLLSTAPQWENGLSPIADEQAARMRRVIGQIDPANLSPDQRAVLERADKAVVRIRASDARLKDMRAAVDVWRKSPSPLAGGQIVAAYEAVTEYDRKRFTAVEQRTYAELEGDFYVVAGKSIGMTSATRAKLPVFVVVRDVKGGPAEVLADTVTAGLLGKGYHLADNRAGAAMIVELTGQIDSHGVTHTSSAAMPGALASAALRVFWASDGSEFDRESAKQGGVGGSAEQAVKAALQNAAELLAERFNHFIETGDRQ